MDSPECAQCRNYIACAESLPLSLGRLVASVFVAVETREGKRALYRGLGVDCYQPLGEDEEDEEVRLAIQDYYYFREKK